MDLLDLLKRPEGKTLGHPVLDEDTLELLTAEARRVTDEYDAACRRIREHLRAKNRAPAA